MLVFNMSGLAYSVFWYDHLGHFESLCPIQVIHGMKESVMEQDVSLQAMNASFWLCDEEKVLGGNLGGEIRKGELSS